jgi:hypothetical protein
MGNFEVLLSTGLPKLASRCGQQNNQPPDAQLPDNVDDLF